MCCLWPSGRAWLNFQQQQICDGKCQEVTYLFTWRFDKSIILIFRFFEVINSLFNSMRYRLIEQHFIIGKIL